MRQYPLFYKKGDWKAECDRCGFDHKASDLRLEWTGLRVCSKCWEPRQPQDFVRGVPDRQAPPWTRPRGADTFVNALLDQNGEQITDQDGNPILT